MHLFDFHGHFMQSLLLVQVIGFPLAFVVRSIVWAIRAWRGGADGRRRGWMLAGANLAFAAAIEGFCCLSSPCLPVAFATGLALLFTGCGLSVAASQQARRMAPARTTTRPAALSAASISIRASRLGRRRQAS
jgi:hypothetical protein